MGVSHNNTRVTMRTILIIAFLFVILLDVFAVADDEVDRTFNLFKKKKEKLKEKDKPKYKPDLKGVKRTFFKKKHKNKEKKPSYKPRPSYHPVKPSYHPEPYHGPQHHQSHGPVPYPISASRHFGQAVVGPHHSWPQAPHFGPIGYRNNFPF